MEVKHAVCCGLDVHGKSVSATLRRAQGRAVETEYAEFTTTTKGILELSEWLTERGCRAVAMESTGIYWKPVYHVLEGVFDLAVANAYQVKNLPGRKTDKADSAWLAELHAHGLIAPSFVPPPEIRVLRNLTRTRVKLVQDRANYKNRIHKLLEDANIKLGNVASDVFGVSGRAMLAALVAGERDPAVLANLAKGTLRRKLPELELALSGSFTEHHAVLLKSMLDVIDVLSTQVAVFDERIGAVVEELQAPLQLLETIPGIDTTSARDIIGEIGLDMSRFGSDKRLASWASLCPSNNESAGKKLHGKTRRGNKYLRRILAQCAWATRDTPSYLGRTFRRLQARIGGKKAAIAVGHKILVIVYHVLLDGVPYDETRYDPLGHKHEEAKKRRAIRALNQLGYDVTIAPQRP